MEQFFATCPRGLEAQLAEELGAALGMGPVFWSMAALLGAGAWFVNRRGGRA